MTEQTIAQPTEKEWDTFLQKVLKEPSLLDSLAKEDKNVRLEIEEGLVEALKSFYKNVFVESVAGTDLATTVEAAQVLGKGKLAQAILEKIFRLTPSQFSQALQSTDQKKLWDIAFEVPRSHNPRALAEEFTGLSDTEFAQAMENLDFGHFVSALQKQGNGDIAEVLNKIALKLGLANASEDFGSDSQSTPNGAQLARRVLPGVDDRAVQVRVLQIVETTPLDTSLGLSS